MVRIDCSLNVMLLLNATLVTSLSLLLLGPVASYYHVCLFVVQGMAVFPRESLMNLNRRVDLSSWLSTLQCDGMTRSVKNMIKL